MPAKDKDPNREVAVNRRAFHDYFIDERFEAGLVAVDGVTIKKASESVPRDAAIEAAAPHPYASRGGVKLAAALDAFALDPARLVCLDLGASTGGFTDVLLKRGAAMVIAGIVIVVINPGGFGVDGFALAAGGGLSVLLINYLFRLGVSGDREREAELLGVVVPAEDMAREAGTFEREAYGRADQARAENRDSISRHWPAPPGSCR